MQEIEKRKIVIASVLKPVDDTRMFEKISNSLNEVQFEVHVIGYPTQAQINSKINVHPSKRFKRISFQRFVQPLVVLRKVLKINPDLLIISTHELLFISMVLKLLKGCRVIYDVQENYYRNILFTDTFPFLLRAPLAFIVRLKEILSMPFINHFVLAEKGYAKELSFIGRKFTVIENKVKKPEQKRIEKSESNNIQLLFSGTLAENTGVFEGVKIAKALHEIDPSIQLTIIGCCSKASVFERLKFEIQQFNYIKLKADDNPIPHEEIIAEIIKADFGLILNPINKTTENRTPTKLFEYIGHYLPLIITDYKPWTNRCEDYPACITIDLNKPDFESIINQMKSKQFYQTLPTDIFWEDDYSKLIEVVQDVLKNR